MLRVLQDVGSDQRPAQSAGDLVTKNELMDRVWPGAIVEDNTLQVHISAIRKALGPDRGMLKTASGRGYRLLGAWTFRQESASSADSIDVEPAASPASQFAPICRRRHPSWSAGLSAYSICVIFCPPTEWSR